MKFGTNIIFSFVMHVTIFTAALAVAGKDVMFRFPERFIMMRLFENPAAQKTGASGTEREKRRVITTGNPVIRLREASPPETPPPTQRQGKEHPVVHQQDKPFEDGAGLAGASPAAEDAVTLQSGRISGPSQGSMQLAASSKVASQGTQESGKNKTGSGNREVINTIRAAIERAKSYPPLARKRGIEGTATAEFTINSRGVPENIRILKSSGSDILDSAAKNTVLKASPFPPVSGGIEVPITFRIDN